MYYFVDEKASELHLVGNDLTNLHGDWVSQICRITTLFGLLGDGG